MRSGFVGVRYSVSLYAEGTRAISWRITSGNLPMGLILNNDGTITGIPTVTGEYIFTVEAVNNWGTDTAVFAINIYTQESSSNTEARIVYEYNRTIESLTTYELSMLPGDIYIIAAVMPRFRITLAGTYRFSVNIYQTVQTGLTLVWFPFASSGSGGGDATFLTSNNTVITTVPSNRRITISVYLDVGTYAPVIAALRPSEPDEPVDPVDPVDPVSPDKPSTKGGGGGGGCEILNLGMLLLALVLVKR